MWDAVGPDAVLPRPHRRERDRIAKKDHERSLLPSQDAKDRGKSLARFSQLKKYIFFCLFSSLSLY